MKEKDFDAQLRAALDPLEAPYDPASWAMLEQRLNASFTEEDPAPVDVVDKAVFHKLQQLEAPYQAAHWQQLAGRMQDLARLRLRLRVSKVAEAAILLLLLLNLRGSVGEKKPLPPTKPTYHGPIAAAPAAPSPAATAQRQYPGAGQWSGSNDGLAHDAATGIFQTNQADGAMMLLDPLGQPGAMPTLWPVPTSHQPFLLSSAQNGQADLAALPPELLPFAWQPGQPLLPPGTRVAIALPRPSRMYFAAYASTDRNRIQTGDGLSRTQGFTTGFLVGYRWGKWGVETGLAYAQKQYTPQKKIEIYDGNVSSGYFGSFLGEVNADLLTIPVKATRQLMQVGKTSVHAVAGASVNIATHKAYRYRTVQFPGSTPSSQGSGLAAQPQLRQTGQGVLENGGLTDNTYVTADLGLRLERSVAGRWTAFIEPGFRQALSTQGLGPNPAKINAFTIQAGVMAAL